MYYRHEYKVLWLPPYHPILNPIEEAWGLTKNYVAMENDGANFGRVKQLILDGLKKAEPSWPKLVNRAVKAEDKYILEDRIRLNEPPGSPLTIDLDESDDEEIDERDDEEFDDDTIAEIDNEEMDEIGNEEINVGGEETA
jgi:hypothetical protein